ncbi:MAG: PAS domain-containing methyl-accepting chemotaxis protein [Ancalomicrobiaceae bacterium]|nr:PAS domain-containing methyl-accepting chemotaxis protein [Ancalomicrobiaceae bacterium]
MWPFSASSAQRILEAISRSQAIIEFLPDGTIVTANDNFLKALGYKLEEIKGKQHSMFVEPTYAKSRDYEQFWHALRGGTFQAAEFKRIGKGGREVWIRASYNPVMVGDKVVKVVKFATDVTEDKLRAAEFESQIKAIDKSQAVIEFDMSGQILNANANFLNAIGYRLEEVKGKHHSMFCDPAFARSADYTRFWDDLRAGRFQAGEFRRIGKGGKDLWLQASYNPINDMNGKTVKVVKFAADITAAVIERQRRAAAQKEIVSDVEEISRLVEQASQHAATSAGESQRTSGNVQAMASGSEELAASVAEISRQVSHALAITGDAVKQAEHTNAVVSGLAAAAQKIGQVVEMISNIAGQTNLLALNATIEAARAGEMGRGFAVVAAEVKQLADQTAKATADIGAQITSVQNTTTEAVQAIGSISTTIGRINEISSSIATAVEEQSSVTRDMSGNMQSAAQGVETVTQGMTEIARSAELVDTATRRLRDAARAIA